MYYYRNSNDVINMYNSTLSTFCFGYIVIDYRIDQLFFDFFCNYSNLLSATRTFFNCKQKNNHYTANLKHLLQTKNIMFRLILRLY